MYKFHCGFCADNKLFSPQQQHCDTRGNHSAIRNENLYSTLAFIIKKDQTLEETIIKKKKVFGNQKFKRTSSKTKKEE